MGVEYFGFFLLARQRIVRTGEGSPNLYSPSAGTGEYEPRLGLFPGKTFHKGYFGLAGKAGLRSVPRCRCRFSSGRHRSFMGIRLPGVLWAVGSPVAALAGQAASQLLAESGYGLGFGLRFDFL